MLPILRQRIVIALSVLGGGLTWLAAAGPLRAVDGSTGISLLSALGGPVLTWVIAMVISLPSVFLGVVCSSMGNPLAGYFAASAALSVLAVSGGQIDGWRHRMEDAQILQEAYGGLMAEVLMWQAIPLGMVVLNRVLRRSIQAKLRPLVIPSHFQADGPVSRFSIQSLLVAAVCAAVATVVGYLLIPVAETTDSSTAQVMMGLLIAFVLGGLVAHLFFPLAGTTAILFAPALVAIVVYGFVYFRFDSQLHLIAAWQDTTLPATQRLPGLALALPIHYVSAGVMGTTLGIGWAQSLMVRDERPPFTDNR